MADLGKILLMPKGEYSASYTYSYLDVVTYQRSSYVCKVGSSLNVVPTNTTNWQLLSPHGEDAYGFGYIRYSEYADGTGFVSTPTSETKYVGFYMGNSPTPPTDKEDYQWSKFVGENGQDGSDGQNGNVWGTGTALTGTGTNLTGYAGIVGDCYLNTTSSNVYQCTASGTVSTAKWSYICNIKGNSGSGIGDMESNTYAPTAKSQGLSNVVDSALSLNGLTASVTELNYMDGVTSAVQTQLNNKVPAVSGKGLSTEDYTTAEKNKLSGIEAGAEVNVIDEVSSEFSVTSKTLSLASSVTSKLSYVDTNGSIQDALDLKADASDLASKADTTDLDEWTSEATATTSGTDTVVTFTELDDSLAYDIYCDAINTSAEVKSKTGSGTNVTLVYKLTGSNVLVGTTKAKLRIVK